MGGEVGRKDKTTHELSSERSLIQGKKGSENVLEAFNDSQECVMFPVTLERKAEPAHPEGFSSLPQFRVQPADWGGGTSGNSEMSPIPISCFTTAGGGGGYFRELRDVPTSHFLFYTCLPLLFVSTESVVVGVERAPLFQEEISGKRDNPGFLSSGSFYEAGGSELQP